MTENQVLLNKDGSIKKIQEKKTENKNIYMKEYIKNSEVKECDICNGTYKKYAYYKHIQGKFHILKQRIKELEK